MILGKQRSNAMKSYIHEISEGDRGWRYGSDLAIYTERLIDGRLLAAALIDNGIPIQAGHETRDLPAFDLVVDGESLAFGWDYVGFSAAPGKAESKLVLRHPRKQIELAGCKCPAEEDPELPIFRLQSHLLLLRDPEHQG